MIFFDKQKPIYLTLITEPLYEKYESQFDCDTIFQTEACKEEFESYLRQNPHAAIQVFLGWSSEVDKEAYRKFYRSWIDPFTIVWEDEDTWLLNEFLTKAQGVFKGLNSEALKTVLLQYKDRLISVTHPSYIFD